MTPSAAHGLAKAHMAPPPLAGTALAERHDGVLLRYDGVTTGGVPKVFAVVTLADLAKVPKDVISDLELLTRGTDDVLRGSPDAFFRKTPAGTALYVDTDVYEMFVDDILEAAGERGIAVLNAVGDLRLMTRRDGEMAPGRVPAFVANGFAPVPVTRAVRDLAALRDEMGLALDDAPDIEEDADEEPSLHS